MERGIQFAEQPRNRDTIYSQPMLFDMIYEGETLSAIGPRTMIEHRLTNPNHPWTSGQVVRTRRTIRYATVKRFHCDDLDQLLTHLADYNFARWL